MWTYRVARLSVVVMGALFLASLISQEYQACRFDQREINRQNAVDDAKARVFSVQHARCDHTKPVQFASAAR